MRVIVAGPRNLKVSMEVISRAVANASFRPEEIVTGGARGIDAIAHLWASRWRLRLRVFTPKWKEHGRAAGPIRNRQMAEYADALIVIKRQGKDTPGTTSMVREAEKRELPIHIEEV